MSDSVYFVSSNISIYTLVLMPKSCVYVFVTGTNNSLQIQTVLQTWTKTYPTTPNMMFEYSRCLRNGCGANHGVPTKPRQKP